MKEREELFQKHWKEKDWLSIWYDIEFAVSNLTKKNCKFHYRADFDEIVEEATLTIWSRLKKKVEADPNFELKSLINYCYLPTYFTMKNPKKQFEESLVSLEEMQEKGVSI